jgi:hypothetical protein
MMEIEIESGNYTIQLYPDDAPQFKSDTIIIKPYSKNCFEIQLGTNGGFQSIQIR